MKMFMKLTVVALSIFAVAQVEALTCPQGTVMIKLNNGSYACEGLGGNGMPAPVHGGVIYPIGGNSGMPAPVHGGVIHPIEG